MLQPAAAPIPRPGLLLYFVGCRDAGTCLLRSTTTRPVAESPDIVVSRASPHTPETSGIPPGGGARACHARAMPCGTGRWVLGSAISQSAMSARPSVERSRGANCVVLAVRVAVAESCVLRSLTTYQSYYCSVSTPRERTESTTRAVTCVQYTNKYDTVASAPQ